MTPSPGWRKCTVYRQTGLGDAPLGLSLSEGLGGTGVAAMVAWPGNLLLGLLELHDVALWVPAVEDDVTTEVPGARLWLEVAARGFDCAPNLR